MIHQVIRDVLVISRGELSTEAPALAVRVALALPLGGLNTRLVLVDATVTLGLADAADLSPWSGRMTRELDALIKEQETPVLVELESLRTLGLEERTLRRGVDVATRAEVTALCAAADLCLVL
ncbi:MAG TPA: hypothetical protein VMV12_02625 [Candidatus Micrarchaeaceae archaeon]|nr:hypothetical protein [Candidatus Micrarchaeaceae archaeon]